MATPKNQISTTKYKSHWKTGNASDDFISSIALRIKIKILTIIFETNKIDMNYYIMLLKFWIVIRNWVYSNDNFIVHESTNHGFGYTDSKVIRKLRWYISLLQFYHIIVSPTSFHDERYGQPYPFAQEYNYQQQNDQRDSRHDSEHQPSGLFVQFGIYVVSPTLSAAASGNISWLSVLRHRSHRIGVTESHVSHVRFVATWSAYNNIILCII